MTERATEKPCALVCASHTPLLLDEELADAAVCEQVRGSFERMREFVCAFQPEQIIQFSRDHFHGFHYDNMPSFCVGAAATSYGDYGTATGDFNVDEDFAVALLEAMRAEDIDASLSYAMRVDHGFVQLWETMLSGFADLPIIPVFVNAIGYPLPTYQRARLLGEAAGRLAAATGRRVLFAASGGLSHDPIVPLIRGAGPELRDRLTGRTKLSREQQANREYLVRGAAEQALRGEGPCRPLNPEWDSDILRLLRERDWATIDAFTAEQVRAAAGAGGNEVLAWGAAASAMAAAAGAFQVVQEDYVAIPGWTAGLAHLSAKPA